MSILFYNPFLPLTEGLLQHMLRKGKPYWVVQRFSWPGIETGKAFMASEYADKLEAEAHAMKLEHGEGKLLDLTIEEALSKLLELIKTGSGYKVFYNSTLDKKNEKKLHKTYVKKVHNYIRSIAMKNDGGYDVFIRVVNGRVVGIITSGDRSHEAPFYKMIS
ncbi:hypothetical protein [Desertivirga brevis]|uniref:hypothetical protein n=1 Tax=Desertivirga brevis TaxID=2810310 RepID=UPI001A9576CC|nr:hypothetical protein [Pedobacter sp. SYSU D00873]